MSFSLAKEKGGTRKHSDDVIDSNISPSESSDDPKNNPSEVSYGAYTEQRVVESAGRWSSFVSKMGSKDAEEPDGWLSYPQTFKTLVLMMEPNGCLVAVNSTRFTCTFGPAALSCFTPFTAF